MFVANDLLVYHIERGVLSPLRSDVRAAVWHPDGTRITFASGAGGPTNLFSIVADGSSPPERLTTNNRNQFPTSWSPGGKALAFTQIAEGVNLDIWVLSMRDGLPTAHAFLATPFIEQWPEFSPDGRWLAYGSNESGRNEVWVQAYPGPGRREQVSTNGGTQPVWAQNGRELFYTEPAPDGHVKMMAVPVTTGETFTAGRPQILFEGPYSTTVPVRSYDVTRDANRFLWDRSREASMATPITQVVLVQNWQEELKRLVPTN
jgi:serine/threonine-protein kinase